MTFFFIFHSRITTRHFAQTKFFIFHSRVTTPHFAQTKGILRICSIKVCPQAASERLGTQLRAVCFFRKYIVYQGIPVKFTIDESAAWGEAFLSEIFRSNILVFAKQKASHSRNLPVIEKLSFMRKMGLEPTRAHCSQDP